MGTELQTIELSTPGKDIESYLSSVHSIPILTPVQERELAQKLYDNDDLDAARQIVLAHLRFVVHISRTYSGYGLPLADIIQEGNVGLMKAVDRFDPNKGVRLVSFAVHWIKAEIHEYILKNWRLVKIATTKAQRKLFFNLRSKKKSLDWLTKDEAEKIAEDLNVEVKDVLHMENRLSSNDSSFDGPAVMMMRVMLWHLHSILRIKDLAQKILLRQMTLSNTINTFFSQHSKILMREARTSSTGDFFLMRRLRFMI